VRSAMVQSVAVKGPAGPAIAVARAAIALDPPAPMRYRGMSVQFDGLGTALAAAVSDTAAIQSLAELMRRGLPFQWRQAQVAPAPNPAAAAAAEQGGSTQLLLAERLLRWMESATAGQGFERCLYELNANIPCRSPLLSASWVADPADLLKALELAARQSPGVPPVDRHIAAFLASRGRGDMVNHLISICAGKRDGQAVIGMLTAYAWMQRTANMAPMPRLAAWCLTYLKPAIEAYHYRPLRAKIEQKVGDAAREGDLSGMLSAIDNIEQLRRDEAGFRAAVMEHKQADNEIHICTTRGDERAYRARRSGRETAAMAAAALSMVAMSALIIMGGL
jgi:eukaryotic-like serine/threonine-protein kinase